MGSLSPLRLFLLLFLHSSLNSFQNDQKTRARQSKSSFALQFVPYSKNNYTKSRAKAAQVKPVFLLVNRMQSQHKSNLYASSPHKRQGWDFSIGQKNFRPFFYVCDLQKDFRVLQKSGILKSEKLEILPNDHCPAFCNHFVNEQKRKKS